MESDHVVKASQRGPRRQTVGPASVGVVESVDVESALAVASLTVASVRAPDSIRPSVPLAALSPVVVVLTQRHPSGDTRRTTIQTAPRGVSPMESHVARRVRFRFGDTPGSVAEAPLRRQSTMIPALRKRARAVPEARWPRMVLLAERPSARKEHRAAIMRWWSIWEACGPGCTKWRIPLSSSDTGQAPRWLTSGNKLRRQLGGGSLHKRARIRKRTIEARRWRRCQLHYLVRWRPCVKR